MPFPAATRLALGLQAVLHGAFVVSTILELHPKYLAILHEYNNPLSLAFGMCTSASWGFLFLALSAFAADATGGRPEAGAVPLIGLLAFDIHVLYRLVPRFLVNRAASAVTDKYASGVSNAVYAHAILGVLSLIGVLSAHFARWRTPARGSKSKSN